MIIANLHRYEWARDLHQWIPSMTSKVELKLLGTGNYKVVKVERMYEEEHPFMVFNRMGYCISHIPPHKVIAKGAMPRWPKITNISTIKYEL